MFTLPRGITIRKCGEPPVLQYFTLFPLPLVNPQSETKKSPLCTKPGKSWRQCASDKGAATRLLVQVKTDNYIRLHRRQHHLITLGDGWCLPCQVDGQDLHFVFSGWLTQAESGWSKHRWVASTPLSHLNLDRLALRPLAASASGSQLPATQISTQHLLPFMLRRS